MNILNKIVITKRKEIEIAKKMVTLNSLIEKIPFFLKTHKARSFKNLFSDTKKGVLIAEIKPRSPSSGILIQNSPLEIADLYAKSKADIISVLTDKQYFGGSLDLLEKVRPRVPQPLLRKDFIIDKYQVYETLLAGADAYLLIAAILSENELVELIALGKSLKLETLVEVHSANDIEKALRAGAEIIGINNRDLETLEITLDTTEHLIKYIPKEIPVVSESGIKTAKDVLRLKRCGIKGILVGTSILLSDSPLDKIIELKNVLNG